MGLIDLEVAVEAPDQVADALLRGAVQVGEGVELVHETLGVHPAEAVRTDFELSGVIADDGGRREEAVCLDAAPERAFGGDADRVGRDVERRKAEAVEMSLHALRSAKRVSPWPASKAMTVPARLRPRM